MKWSRLTFILLGILISLLLPVVSMYTSKTCTQDLSSTLRSLTRQADMICEAAVKKGPSDSTVPPGGVVDNIVDSRRPVAGDTVTIKIRRILKGSKKVYEVLLPVKIPKRDLVNSCVRQLKRGDKLIFFLRKTMDSLRLEMLIPPVKPTKVLTRKLRRQLSMTNLRKKNRKVAEGKKLKLTCTSSHRNAKFRWLRNGKLIQKSREMSFKKKNQGKANPKSILRIRKVRQDHTGIYTCNIDVGGKKYIQEFNITVIEPSEIQCADQKYCFNKGECWQKLPPLDEKYCKCHMNFSGLRCESVSINSSLLRNFQNVTGRNKSLTHAVIAIGAVLAVLALGMLVAFTFFVCHHIKRRHRREHQQTMSYQDSFIHPGIPGDTYCHISSDDVLNSDNLVLSTSIKPTDECLVSKIQESMFTDPQLISCNNRKYIPALHSPYMQFSPTTKAEHTASQQYIIQPTRLRLPAVSSSQFINNETTVNDFDHVLDTQVIYAEPNHVHVGHNSDNFNCTLTEDLTCDRPNALSTCYHANEHHQPPHPQPGSVVCSTPNPNYLNLTPKDSEEDLNAKDLLLAELHISEEDLITDIDEIRKSGGPGPRNYPNVINPDCYGTRLDENDKHQDSLPVNGQNVSPSYRSFADSKESLGSAIKDRSPSQLITNAYNGPLGNLEDKLHNQDKSDMNFVF